MKLNFIRIFSAYLCMITIMSTSCSKNEEFEFPIEQEIAGSYITTIQTITGHSSSEPTIQKVIVQKETGKSISINMSNFYYNGLEIDKIQLKNCFLKKERKKYTFEGTSQIEGIFIDTVIMADGYISEGTIEMKMNVLIGPKDKTKSFSFYLKGNQMKGNENTKAEIVSFAFVNQENMVKNLIIDEPEINQKEKTITFTINEGTKSEDLKNMVPIIGISKKAKLMPASNVPQDFSDGRKIKYVVKAEDGSVTTYTAFIRSTVKTYDFEDWTYSGLFTKTPLILPWATCNDAISLIKSTGFLGGISYRGEFPVRPSDDAFSGSKSAMVESVNTVGGSLMGQKIPKVTTGTLFLGFFDAYAAAKDPMKTTSFGVIYDKKPLEVMGYYKYKPGKDFYNADGKLIEGKADECCMSAVLYEVDKNEDTLDGNNIYQSDKIIAQAVFKSAQIINDFKPFVLKLNYTREYDKTKKYKLAIIISSSSDGANYNAAVGSTLIVDHIKVYNAYH